MGKLEILGRSLICLCAFKGSIRRHRLGSPAEFEEDCKRSQSGKEDISGICGHVGHEANEAGPPGRVPLELLSSLPFPSQSHGFLFLHL